MSYIDRNRVPPNESWSEKEQDGVVVTHHHVPRRSGAYWVGGVIGFIAFGGLPILVILIAFIVGSLRGY